MDKMAPNANQYEILVVDDTPDSLRFLKHILEQQGYLVRAASEGPLAIQSVEARLPDLILLDVKMEGMDGYEVCRRLKSNPRSRKVPVIFISALHETIDKVKGFKVGGVDYITKPLEPEEVFARVKTHLQLQELTGHLEQKVRERTAELTVAKEQAEAASIAKSKFLSKMSHELHTPLNPIMGYAQLLKKGKNLTEEQKKQLQIVCDSCAKVTTLIGDILEIARIDTCQWTVEHSAFNLQGLLRMVVNDAQRKADNRNLAIHHEEVNLLPEMVFGDCRMLNRILIHLLDNAIKFTEQGNIVLRTSVEKSPETEAEDSKSKGRWRIRFDVEDTGIGIHPEIMDDIFQPFYQGEIEGRVLDGAGLGLTISRRLVDLMGGQLLVQSPSKLESGPKGEPGTSFTLELDFGAIEDDIPGKDATSARIPPYQGEHKKILIVDNDCINLNFLVNALEFMGFDISQTDNGWDAVEKAAQSTPDLILLDLLMPDADGNEVLKQIRLNDDLTQVKIIGISATGVGEERLAKFIAACDDFIEKPVKIDDLLKKIERQLEIQWVK